ncbi:MAG: NAD-dependent protein deacylase [Oscillospiraceae bacterium]|nr:NAD-dependent protein deacylase [Oscillospiraceae bacterium]
MTREQHDTLQNILRNAKKLVFFGGAGVSTESGIPDFRSVDGLYNQKYDYPPETILSATFFYRHTEEFYRFYRDKMLCLTAKPNAAHKKLAEMEQLGILADVVTQNIDGLHQAAGSEQVDELHGSVHRNYCRNCGKFYDAQWILQSTGVPRCEDCGGLVKPDVVLYEEGLPNETVDHAVRSIANADVLIVGGTSLNVYPAAGFLRYFHGSHLIVMNRDETQADKNADLVIRDKIGEVLESIDLKG